MTENHLHIVTLDVPYPADYGGVVDLFYKLQSLHQLGIKIHLMQNSAISFSVCIDNDSFKAPKVVEQLQKSYKVLYNDNLQLFTVRHYYHSTVEMLTAGKEILLEQRTRHTAQFVVRVLNE